MSTPTGAGDPSAHEERLNETIAIYLQAVESGQPPDHKEFLARYPDLAANLESFFADKAYLERLDLNRVQLFPSTHVGWS